MTPIFFINRFFHPDHSATSQIVSDLVFDLASRGLSVNVVTSRQLYENPGAGLAKSETIRGVRIHRVWSTSFGRGRLVGRAIDYLSFYSSCFLFLLWHLSKQARVVAMTDPPLIGVVAMLAGRLRGARLIHWVQDLFPEVAQALGVSVARGPLGAFLLFLRNLSFQSADLSVAIGDLMAEKIRSQRISPEKIRVIHNGSDGAQVRPIDRENNALRKSWGLDNRFVAAYSGNMGRAHEFETILEAARILRDEAAIVFLFIGSGKQKEEAQAQVLRDGLTNVLFKPYQPREILGQSLSAADVHLVCLKPELEGLIVPSKFYGALAAARAVLNIGSLQGEIARWVSKIGCGETVEPGQAERLAGFLKEFSQDIPRCRQAGLRGRAYFEENFDRAISEDVWYHVLTS